MTAAGWRIDRRAAGALLLLVTALAHAQPQGMQARLEGTVQGYAGLAPGATGKPLPLTVHTTAQALRADFHFQTRGLDVYLLKRSGEPRAWWISPQGRYMIPANDASGPYWYDLRNPCATLQGRCSPAQGEFIAGRLAKAVRYDNARNGPDGTTRGTLWIDTQTGLMLGYRGTVGSRQDSRSFRARQVTYEVIDAALFEMPGNYNTPKGMDD